MQPEDSIQSKPGEGDGKQNSEGIEVGLNREAINIRAALIMPIIKSSKIVLKMVKITCCWILSEDDITNISLQQKINNTFSWHL